VGTYQSSSTPNAMYLLDAQNGAILRTLSTGGQYFAQPVFAEGYVVTANIATGVDAYEVQPTITTFTPTTGRPGATVVITGVMLDGATEVRFGTVDATFTVDSSTQVTATVPDGAPASAMLSVDTPDGTAVSSTPFRVPPSIASFVPAKGTAGTVVTISGSGFAGATRVTLGRVPQPFVVDSTNQIRATINARAPGSARFAVTTPGGTAKSGTVMKVAPHIDSFTPSSGGQGTSVVITGKNFTGTTRVSFGTVAAQSFIVNSATRITAKVPAGVRAARHLTVVTPGGSAVSAGTFN
jgi:hypothetical protein